MIITGLVGALVTSRYKVGFTPALVRLLLTFHSVGLLRLRLRRLPLGGLYRRLDCAQARPRHRP